MCKKIVLTGLSVFLSLILILVGTIIIKLSKQLDFCKQSSKIQKFSPENAEFFGVNFLL